MNDSARQLRVIGEVVEAAAAGGAEIWLRGGWAMDFYLGEITRPHRDIDFFAWASDIDRLLPGLRALDYRDDPDSPPADLQRDLLTPEGLDVSVTLLGRDTDGCPTVPAGPAAGERWPADMLDGSPGRLGGLTCRIVNPRAQIEIKQMMPVWVPGLPRRPKDAEDIARLRAALTNDAGR
jgi:aminoglycoside-2''-adenylyltransferase